MHSVSFLPASMLHSLRGPKLITYFPLSLLRVKLILLTLFFGSDLSLQGRKTMPVVWIICVQGVSFSLLSTLVCLQVTGPPSVFRFGKWRTILWTSTTWWISPCPWTMTWIIFAIWGPSWLKRCENSLAISVWDLALSWTKTFLLSPIRHQDTKTIPALGKW